MNVDEWQPILHENLASGAMGEAYVEITLDNTAKKIAVSVNEVFNE